ncbi:hypothetical protein DFH06DRAFT_1342441 [Mycena polygramma]|nr:hypothetical protein DFH06DRAFT_1342441 [Mycena polygramma]
MAIVKLLVEGGSDFNANSVEALSDASERGNAEIVELLINALAKQFIKAGADVDANSGEALSAVSEMGNKEVVMLIGAGAKVNANDGYG